MYLMHSEIYLKHFVYLKIRNLETITPTWDTRKSNSLRMVELLSINITYFMPFQASKAVKTKKFL